MISSNMKEKKINASFEELKGKDTFFVSEKLRQGKAYEGSESYSKAKINFVFSVINATIDMWTKRLHPDEKILMLSSSIVCFWSGEFDFHPSFSTSKENHF